MAKSLRVGMIGYRFMGKAHSNAWRQAPHFFPLKAGVELHTICGRDPKAVEAAQKQLGWKHASTDWEKVVNSKEIDIIDINTPNDSHAPIAIAAAKAGKHVLCEKPLALTVEQCQQMLDAAKKAGIVHMVCHYKPRIWSSFTGTLFRRWKRTARLSHKPKTVIAASVTLGVGIASLSPPDFLQVSSDPGTNLAFWAFAAGTAFTLVRCVLVPRCKRLLNRVFALFQSDSLLMIWGIVSKDAKGVRHNSWIVIGHSLEPPDKQ